MFRNKPCKCYRNVKSVKGDVPDRVPRNDPVQCDEAVAAGSGGAQLRFGRAELPRERRGVFFAQVVRTDKLAYQEGVLFKISRRDAAVHGEQPAAVGFAQQAQKLCTRVVYGQVRHSGKERFAPRVIFCGAEHIEAAHLPSRDDTAAAAEREACGDQLLIPRIERGFGGERTYDLRAETARRENYERLYKLIYNSGYNPNETELSDSGMTVYYHKILPYSICKIGPLTILHEMVVFPDAEVCTDWDGSKDGLEEYCKWVNYKL